jgi:undecaprenyl-diphosphatase
MTWLEAIILGLVQGLTEFLPVSSSGHLEIGQALLGTAGTDNLTFTVTVHVATVLSTIVVLRREVAALLRGTFTTTAWNKEKDYAAKILISMIPVFVVGMFFKDQVEALFGSGLLLVGICLLITATLLFVSEYVSKHRQTSNSDNNAVIDTANLGESITYKSAFIIGLAQAVAVLPGISRSGSTIATGLLCGAKKNEVAQFSFLMVLIPILGEAFLDILKFFKGDELTTAIPASALVIGFLAAFISGCLACKFMLTIVRRQKLTYFAIYCLAVGLFTIIYSQLAHVHAL